MKRIILTVNVVPVEFIRDKRDIERNFMKIS